MLKLSGGLVAVVPDTADHHPRARLHGAASPRRPGSCCPNPGFTGTDRVAFGVVDPATGGEQPHSAAVTVTP